MEVIEESRLRCIRLALPLRAPEWAAVRLNGNAFVLIAEAEAAIAALRETMTIGVPAARTCRR